MDRARVLCPSISVAAHAAGLGMLIAATLLLPERLPVPPEGPGIIRLGPSMLDRIAGPPAGGPAGPVRSVPPRVPPRPSCLGVFLVPAGVVPDPYSIDLTGTPGIEGLPPGPLGEGTGGCLVDCGTGPVGNSLDPDAFLPKPVDPPPPVRAGHGGLQEPRKVRHVAPAYPPLAIAARVQGRVVLDCVIDEGGRIASVTVLSGNPLLDEAAAAAVRQWRYTPTLLNGVVVSVLLTVTVDFTLR